MNAEADTVGGLVLLHDHLDGGVRPATMIDLADQLGWHGLGTTDPSELERILIDRASRGSLDQFLSCFGFIQPLLQTASALRRIAAEAVEDLVANGIAAAEIRFAPQAHTRRGMTLDGAIEAVLDGLDHQPIRTGLIVTALRHEQGSERAAAAALRWADRGVVGFDLAGAEEGHPVVDHLDAIRQVRGRVGITVHAGEASGPASIQAAIDAGAQRIGHGVALVQCLDEPDVCPGLLDRVVTEQIPLELCPTSNVQIGIVASVDRHPIERLRRAGVNVTVNTDNRTLSGTSLSGELAAVTNAFGWTLAIRERVIENARAALFRS